MTSSCRGVFPPQQIRPDLKWRHKGKQKITHLTVNGRMEFHRVVYWNHQAGSVTPLDAVLGILEERYSPGVREMTCRLSLNEAFAPASDILLRTAQLTLSRNALRELVEREGTRAEHAIRQGAGGPDWTVEDCVDESVITGADGVMVPLVTEQEKQKRRERASAKRKRAGRKSTRKRGRPNKGSDGPYKEFKIVTFYDKDKSHQYAVGTSGDHTVLGRIMRREARKIDIGSAKVAYSVADGAEWIQKQYQQQLPMLDENILDYFHLREHVTKVGHVLLGEGTAESVAWRAEMMGVVWEHGSLVLLDRLGELHKTLRAKGKRSAVDSLRQYVGKRVAMTDYPSFREAGYDTGSGPTESFCKSLTKRVKGAGMRWEKVNAEAIMALGGIYQSNLWATYWSQQRAVA